MSTTLEMSDNAAALLVDRHIAETNGNRVALRYGDKRYTYHDLAALVNRAGNMLRRLGVAAGQAVVVAVAPSPAWAASLFGAMKIGAVPVLAPRSASEGELSALVRKLKPAAVVIDARRLGELTEAPAGAPVIVVGGDLDADHSFVRLMRESASSLTRAAVGQEAAAIGVATGGDVRTATHEQIAGARPLAELGSFDGIDIEAALRAFARGDELAIPMQH